MQAEDMRVAAWKAAIQVGDEQLDQGEGIAYTANTLKDMTETALRDLHSSQPIQPDVLP
jgi:antitoxin ParD1/3/4